MFEWCSACHASLLTGARGRQMAEKRLLSGFELPEVCESEE